MADRDLAKKLGNVPLFGALSKREIGVIANAANVSSHRDGKVLAREGDAGVGLFVLLEGTADVTIGGLSRARLGPGDFFGEIALLDRGPRSASVIATSDGRTAAISEWVFRGLLRQHPTMAIRTLEVLAERVRSATNDTIA
ncbi:MAG: cyclic nucleotide-binding domain-containing protein [Actinomycetota bacterium]